MNKGKSLFIGSWIVSILILVTLNFSLGEEEQSFLGIADQQEEFLRFPYPVEIRSIFPVEGEKLNTGELVLEVVRPDLASRQTMLTHEIAEISANKIVSQSEILSKLAALRAKQSTDLARLDAEIQELETERKINLLLLKQISGEDTDVDDIASGTLSVKLKGLKKQRQLMARSLSSAIANLTNIIQNNEKPDDAKIAKLKVEKQELQRQQANLKIHAKFDSRVGSILYKPGEQVPAFSKIMSLHSQSPQYVKGFIHENSDNRIAPGQVVWVRSQSNQEKPLISGRIESLGSRIVEYPQRLKKSSLSHAWGREVTVSIHQNNSLLLGEKVVIDIEQKQPLSEHLAIKAAYLSNQFNWMQHDSDAKKDKTHLATAKD